MTPGASGWCPTTSSSGPERQRAVRDCTGHPARVTFRFVDTAARDCRAPTACRLLLALAALAWALPAAADASDPSPLTSAADALPRSPVSQADAYAEFKRLFEAGEHAAAVEQARRVVDMAERAEPVVAEELQVAVMNLGLAERTAGDYVAAEASYQRAIGLIEASGRLTSPRYARAHAGLALAYYDARRHDLAAPAFDRAIALNRRAEGLFNEDQLPLLEKQADSLTELGRAEDALHAHRYALRLVGRRHGERSLRYALELESFGRWYTRARAYDASRATLKRSAELIATLEGPEAVELIGPLTAIAENARRWIYDPQARAQSPDEERRGMYHDPVMPGPPSLSPSTIESEGLRALEQAVAVADCAPGSAAGHRRGRARAARRLAPGEARARAGFASLPAGLSGRGAGDAGRALAERRAVRCAAAAQLLRPGRLEPLCAAAARGGGAARRRGGDDGHGSGTGRGCARGGRWRRPQTGRTGPARRRKRPLPSTPGRWRAGGHTGHALRAAVLRVARGSGSWNGGRRGRRGPGRFRARARAGAPRTSLPRRHSRLRAAAESRRRARRRALRSTRARWPARAARRRSWRPRRAWRWQPPSAASPCPAPASGCPAACRSR